MGWVVSFAPVVSQHWTILILFILFYFYFFFLSSKTGMVGDKSDGGGIGGILVRELTSSRQKKSAVLATRFSTLASVSLEDLHTSTL